MGMEIGENIAQVDRDKKVYQLDLNGFQKVYEFIRRYVERNRNDVQIILFTASVAPEASAAELNGAMGIFEQAVCDSLRRSDVSTRYSDSQVVVLLMDANANNGETAAKRIIELFEKSYSGGKVSFSYDVTKIEGSSIFGLPDQEENRKKTILVVDDDKTNLVSAKNALGGLYKVAAAPSGEKALDFLKNNTCDLILLDLIMPVMDGFEVMEKIREMPKCSDIPIIFLTGDRNAETENKCLKAGAVDYIQKPFAVDVLHARIGRILELFDLRNNLQQKVLEKTERIEHLNDNIISALAHTIDAKDRYTSGHSQRVALYARMMAERMGKSRMEQQEIYQAGLLHDVGKIRVPEAVINKEGKLTDEEFEMIKLHPINGYHILREISSEKLFSEGARFHHERFDGKGYPNGLVGTQIPEIARIVGVADAYDAMTSNRSYRKALPQIVVRGEIEKGKGSQFDPDIADIMLALIDEDKEYHMRETTASVGIKKILVVDDEPVNITVVEAFLKDSNIYTVRGCNCGAECLDILKEEKFDIALIDLKMPEMDGYELAAEIRKCSDLPIILMTGDRTSIDMELLKVHNISDFITRPFKPEVLTEILHAVLE